MLQRLNIYSEIDFIIIPISIGILFFVAYNIKRKNKSIIDYKYLIPGLFWKLFGVTIFMLIYVYYYGGGDTIAYFSGAKAISNLMIYDFDKAIDIILNLETNNNSISSFNKNTGWPPTYMWRDPLTFSICRFTAIFTFISFNSFFVSSIFVCVFSYIGIWKLYRMVNILYPGNQNVFAILIIYLPSLIFWGGGIMKDSYVLGSTCWITYNFYMVLISRKKILVNAILILLNFYIILNSKSYVLVSLIPGILLWLNSAYISQISNTIFKVIFFPIIITGFVVAGFFIFNNLGSVIGVYGDVNSAIEKAQIIQQDLLREDQYGGNNYNIGSYDGSVSSLISIAPIAIFTAIFRPLLWEVGSPTMFFSAMENTILIIFTFYIILRTNPIKLFRYFLREPYLLYCFVFSMFLAFGVGIAGTNFGALVRYKIPFLPFLYSMLYIVSRKVKN